MVYRLAMTVGTPHTSQKPPVAVFLAATVILFFLSLSTADSIGFVPDYIDGSTSLTTGSIATDVELTNLPELGEEVAEPATVVASSVKVQLPTRLKIPAIELDLPVQNPSTKDIEALDVLLQKGPVRYVDSAKLGEKGNAIIFGHSSHLPIVRNQMYKAFNRIPELEAGDSITVTGTDGTVYLYKVTSIKTVNAADTSIDMSTELGTRLTIVTCDTLTSKSSRFVLEAEFVSTQEII